MPNRKIIQFYRNNTIFLPAQGKTAKNVAKEYVENLQISFNDGEVIQTRYKEQDEDTKAMLCVYHNTDGQTGWTFIDDGVGDTLIPSKTSDLTNDSGFITTHQDLSAYVNNALYDSSTKKIVLKHDNITLFELDVINTLDSSAIISSINNGIVTIKAGLTETDGVITNSSVQDIVLAKIATTASPSDLNVTYNNTTQDLQTTLNTIKSEINSAASSSTEYIVCNNIASEIPSGFTYYNGVTGTMAASSLTTGKVYLIKNSANSYEQVITTQDGSTYSWTSLGSTTVDLTGVVKNITINGTTYSVTTGNNVNIGEVLTDIIAQTNISNANTDFVHVTSTVSSASNGQKIVTLSAESNIVTVQSGDNGLANASDIKDYVDNRVIFKNWYNNDIVNS